MKSVILNKEKLTGFNVNATAPVGAIIMWASDNLPVGWLKCDHTELLIADYPKLYDRLKDIPQCQSENEGYFYTPDFRDREPQGANGNIGELIEAGLPNITGRTVANAETDVRPLPLGAFYSGEALTASAFYGRGNYKTQMFDASKGETKTDGTLKTESELHVYGNSDTVQPPAFAIHFIIKATQTSDNLDTIIDDSKTDIGHTWSGKKIAEEIENVNTYSTEEKVVGTWIDGKPIYRKMFIGLSQSIGTTWMTVNNVSVPDVDEVINGRIYANEGSSAGGKQFRSVSIGYLNGSFRALSSSGTVTMLKILVEYTKTTD